MHTDAVVHGKGKVDTYFSFKDDFFPGVNWRII